jgi:Glycosyl hydrolase family 71/Concanavalin A-like lectin/glucanases superfamily
MRILISILFVFISVISAAVELQNPDGSLKKTVWTHNTAWHNPLDTGFAVGKYYNYPVFSSSGDQITDYRKEFKLAKKQGIDGFLVDLVCHDGKKTHYAQHMKTMLKAAEGMDFWVGPCLDRSPKPEWQISELTRILKECGNHPNFPRIGNKYVVATYSWYSQSPENWKKIRKGLADNGYPLYLIANMGKGYSKITSELYDKYKGTYEMAYAFGYLSLPGESIDVVYNRMKNCAKKNNATWMGSVWPGYIGAWFNGRNDYYQPHLGFDQVLNYFDVIHSKNPPWVHFTTWNDHDETPFMPMAFEFGANTLINRYLLDRWRGVPLPRKTQIFFAYHREEIIGTVLRIESLMLPGKNSKSVTVSGYLLAPDGKKMYKLPQQTLTKNSTKPYSRNEWNIPTAKLANVPALTPVITVVENGETRIEKLPPVMLKTGWLQNQTTMKIPFDLIVKGKATLTVNQKDNLLTASVKFSCTEKVVRAELWRNDRPIGPLHLKPPMYPLLFAQFYDIGRNNFRARLYKGRIMAAARKSTSKNAPLFAWTNNAVAALQNAPWHHVKMQLTMIPDASFAVKVNNQSAEAVSLKELLRSHVLRFGGKKNKPLGLIMSDYDNNVNDRPDFPGIKNNKLSLKLWSRKKLPNDVFYAQFQTASGKMFFSPIITPFVNGQPIKMNVLQTMVNLETSSGASGKPGRTGFLTKPPFTKPVITKATIHPANLRAGRWTFDHEGWDSLGEQEFRYPKKMLWSNCSSFIVSGGHDSGKCINGKHKVKMRGRIWPMGPCTIEFYLNPGGKITKKQSVIVRAGWTSAFSFYLLPGGKLEVIRDANAKSAKPVAMSSGKPLSIGKWTRIRLVYDGKNAELYCNGKLSAKQAMPFHMVYGNCTTIIGGFSGKLDDLTILSYPVKPGAKGFPALLPPQKTLMPRNIDKTRERAIFTYNPQKGDKRQMKLTKMMPVFSAVAISVAATAAPAKVELGKLIKKADQPPASKSCTLVKGNPSLTKPDEKSTKALVIVGKDGAFLLSTNTKVKGTPTLKFPFKIKDGQELVVKIKNVTTSTKPKGWIATFIGVVGDKKINYAAALSNKNIYVAQRAPKWKSLGGSIKPNYPATLQIRRLNGTLTFVVNGSPRVAIKEGKDIADTPYIYITSQKKASWSILDIASFELREVNKAAIAKEKKAGKNI